MAADSTPTQSANGQEQGDQSNKRVNDLMSLANRRLLERDAARAEIESLKAQLAEREVAVQDDGRSQAEMLYPDRYAEPDAPEVDPMEQPEPVEVHPLVMGVNPRRPSTAYQPVAPTPTTPTERFLRDRAEIAAMKSQLNVAGQRWYEGAREQGLLD